MRRLGGPGRGRSREHPTGPRAAALLSAVVLLLTGCSGADGPAGSASETAGETTGEPSPPDATTALRERCLSAVPEQAELEAFTFTGATGGDIEAARIGPETSSTVAVLLPQIGGLCGWGRWATAAAEQAGLTSLLVNPCGYGESTCTAEEDRAPLNEVAAAVRIARRDHGADRVVLLGASMGGSLTVIAVANGAEVDAWADISGPSAWEGVRLRTLARDLPPTGLVVMARSDGDEPLGSARELARAAGVPFVEQRAGHGWELLVGPVNGSLTRTGRRLLAHAMGGSGG